MNFSNLLNQITDFTSSTKGAQNDSTFRNSGSLTDKIPGGLAGGALAGGVMAVLMSNKKVRKSATTVAKYGGAAVLGGLAYNAYKNWKQDHSNSSYPTSSTTNSRESYQSHSVARPSELIGYEQEALSHRSGSTGSRTFQLALIKAMIASAKADGAMDVYEQNKISEAIDVMQIDNESKADLLELFMSPITIDDFIDELYTLEQKAEAFLASCLVINLDHEAEYAHLNKLARALRLPTDLEQQLRIQAFEKPND